MGVLIHVERHEMTRVWAISFVRSMCGGKADTFSSSLHTSMGMLITRKGMKILVCFSIYKMCIDTLKVVNHCQCEHVCL